MSKIKEWSLVVSSFIPAIILLSIPIFIACQELKIDNPEVPVKTVVITENTETKCESYCETIVNRLNSIESRSGLQKINEHHLYACKQSCSRINDGNVELVISFGDRYCMSWCSTQCQAGKPCLSAANCYENCLNNFNKDLPSDKWFWHHGRGVPICYESKCANELCSSLFLEPTQKQKEYEENSSYEDDICNNCYKKCGRGF